MTATMQIREEDIRSYYSEAYRLLDSSGGSRGGGLGSRGSGFLPTAVGIAATPSAGARGASSTLIAAVDGITANDPLRSEAQSHIVRVLRRALAIALAVHDQYARVSGLAPLTEANRDGGLAADQRERFRELLDTAGVVASFVLASYVEHALSDYMTEVDGRSVAFTTPPKLEGGGPQKALRHLTDLLAAEIKALADDDATLVAVVKQFFDRIVEDVQGQLAVLKHVEHWIELAFKVDADDFVVHGFELRRRLHAQPLVMTFKKPEEVVGNHIAKHQALRLAKMLMCYDFKAQQNPFAELGGFTFTIMGDGLPGTGKTTLIQMICGLVHGFCEVAGYPFRYRNFSVDQLSEYQGKSGQNVKEFIDYLMDPTAIAFGTIDDIDQIAGQRRDRNASAAQQEVTGVLMQAFAGANTVVRGNVAFAMFSNYPENVDDALRQRAGARWLVDGPQSRDDYIDILYLLLGSTAREAIPLGKHEPFAAQALREAVARSYEAHDDPESDALREILARVRKRHGKPDTIERLGSYLHAIREAEPRFTGRAIKNITDAVKTRMMDVDLPDEWFSDPTLFLHHDYETKKGMLMKQIGRPDARMVLQEINRYADSEFRYSASSDEEEIASMARKLRLQREAAKRLTGDA